MGELVVLADRIQERSALRLEGDRPAFYFDLGCPFSYLAAERVERLLGEVEWVPAPGGPGVPLEDTSGEAEERAAGLRLPMVWPERFPAPVTAAMRAASYACEGGAGARFALAAFRLAFCGGYDIEDPAVLAQLAASVGISQARCLEAAANPGRDEALASTARGLGRHEVRALPAFRIGDRWFEGEASLLRAAALQRDRRHQPLARPA